MGTHRRAHTHTHTHTHTHALACVTHMHKHASRHTRTHTHTSRQLTDLSNSKLKRNPLLSDSDRSEFSLQIRISKFCK